MTDARQEITVEFDSRVVSLTAIKKGAYKYLNAFVCDIRIQDHAVRCLLGFTTSISEEAYAQLVDRVSKNDLQSPIFVPGIWTSLTSHPSISRPIDRVFRIDFVIAW